MDAHDPSSHQTAEYAMALDLCSQLTLVLDDSLVLRRILDIFVILFAPRTAVLWVFADGRPVQTLTYPGSIAPPPPFPLPDGPVLSATTPNGFRVSIPYKEEMIGCIEIEGLAFPAYRERYLSLSLAMVGVCGLAVSNARTHTRLDAALADLREEYRRTSRLSEELRVINDTLELRVRERTAELESAMSHLKDEIEQRKAAEAVIRNQLEVKTVLLRELHHRVRNNLQIISSMLSLQEKKTKDPLLRQAISESRNRIRAMSAVHEKILGSSDMSRINVSEYLPSLVASLFSLHRIRPGRIALYLEIPDLVIDINTAIPLGLIVNELVSNSLRHAFPHEASGEIMLSLKGGDRSLTITCGDNGIGISEGYDLENPETVGLILVRSLVEQMEGTIERDPVPGTCFTIRVQNATEGSVTLRGTYNQVSE